MVSTVTVLLFFPISLRQSISHPNLMRSPKLFRPAKRITCGSCRSPRSARTRELQGFEARNEFDICKYGHLGM
jgi:hypothetical protein